MAMMLPGISDAVWTGLIGSASALLGVLLANVSNTRRLRVQLEHDRSEKEKERTSKLRHDVFLPAAEEAAKAMSFISSLPKADLRKVNPMESVQGFFAASAKLHLVADQSTVIPVTQFSAAFGQLLIRSVSKIVPIQKVLIDIEILDGLCERFQSDANRVLSERNRMVETGDPNQALFDQLGSAFEMHQKMATGYAEERAGKWNSYNELIRDFVGFLATEMRPVAQLQIHLLVALRKDLGLGTDADMYLEQLEKQHQTMMSEIGNIYSTIDEELGHGT